ncbi:Penicillin-binding protein OS=Streptomyces glaucescens OX=1907 GN=SGLAU_22830 PE=3 SV=1 [Streptomyces glaucescens]
MTRHIRHAAVFCALLLTALLVNAARIQVFQAPAYDDNPANRRQAIARYGQPRGDILVGGRPVTGSKDTAGRLRYERTYSDGPLYAPVTGFASQVYGSSFLEHAEDGILSGTDPMLAPFPLVGDLTRARSPGGDVATTLNAAAQRAAYAGLGARKGAVAALEPSTGRILALVSTPSYDPESLSGNGVTVARSWAQLNEDPSKPMLNRAAGQTYPPGSTFKVVTAAAALDAGVITDVDAPTDSPAPYTLPGTTTRLTNGSEGCEDAPLRVAFEWSCNTVFARARRGRRGGGHGGDGRGVRLQRDGLRIPYAVAPSTFDTTVDKAQLALSSIGQYNTRATPLQMAMVAAAVANGGQVANRCGADDEAHGSRCPARVGGARLAGHLVRDHPDAAARAAHLRQGGDERARAVRAHRDRGRVPALEDVRPADLPG